MTENESINVAVIVAHPDDETLWAGGMLLSHPHWNVFVLTLCRANDTDRSPKFNAVLKSLGALGTMGDLDDSPVQEPLANEVVEQTIIDLLPVDQYDLILTHHPRGEYTRHLRHEETGKAVINLWKEGTLKARELWCFAFEDGGREYYPKAVETATLVFPVIKEVWDKKYKLITEIYGFDESSWEAHTTPTTECFWQFTSPENAMQWLSSLSQS